MASYIFEPGQNPSFTTTQESADTRAFGGNPDHFFGIVLLGKTTKDTFQYINSLFLEKAPNVGSEAEIQRILNAKSVIEVMQILEELRFFATYPYVYFYPTRK